MTKDSKKPGKSAGTASSQIKPGKVIKDNAQKKSSKIETDNKKISAVVNEIDELFQKSKAKKMATPPTTKSTPTTTTKTDKKAKLSKDDLEFADSKGLHKKVRPLTDDGLPIYTAEEMGILMEGGDTPDCPFDCQCCF